MEAVGMALGSWAGIGLLFWTLLHIDRTGYFPFIKIIIVIMKNIFRSLYEALLAKVLLWLAGITSAQLVEAIETVTTADQVFKDGSGAAKREWVAGSLKQLWQTVKPSIINLVIEVALQLVRKRVGA